MRHFTQSAYWMVCAAVMLAGCGRKAETPARAEPLASPAPQLAAADQAESSRGRSAAGAPQRYLAERHELSILTPASGVEPAWQAALAACAAAGCDVLASSVTHEDETQPAHAALEARVPPGKLQAFFGRVNALGTVSRHTTSVEDKTAEVVDTEAKQKNMAALRDNLRKMMATPGIAVKDLLEVERELARVQSELDALAALRAALAHDTEKIHVSLDFAAKPALLETGMWAPVTRAVTQAGHVLASSVAVLIEVTVALLPWVLPVMGLVIGARAWWRRRKS